MWLKISDVANQNGFDVELFEAFALSIMPKNLLTKNPKDARIHSWDVQNFVSRFKETV